MRSDLEMLLTLHHQALATALKQTKTQRLPTAKRSVSKTHGKEQKGGGRDPTKLP